MTEKETRSPLKRKPLRYAGQSLDEEIDRVIDEDVMGYVVVAFLAIVFAAMEWLRWWLEPPPNPCLSRCLPLALSHTHSTGFGAPGALLKRLSSVETGREPSGSSSTISGPMVIESFTTSLVTASM